MILSIDPGLTSWAVVGHTTILEYTKGTPIDACTLYSWYPSYKWVRSSWFKFQNAVWAAFYMKPVLASGYCRCLRLSVCVSVNPELVRTLTHESLKLGSPNLGHRCKRPWLRPLLFCGALTLTFKVKFNFKKSKFSQFWACQHNNPSPVQARINKFGPEVQNALVKIPIVLGGDWLWPSRSNLT